MKFMRILAWILILLILSGGLIYLDQQRRLRHVAAVEEEMRREIRSLMGSTPKQVETYLISRGVQYMNYDKMEEVGEPHYTRYQDDGGRLIRGRLHSVDWSLMSGYGSVSWDIHIDIYFNERDLAHRFMAERAPVI